MDGGGEAVTFMFNISYNATKQAQELLRVCVLVCVYVYCLPYHMGKPAGRNLSPATLAVFCRATSSFLLRSFSPPLSGAEPFNITRRRELRLEEMWFLNRFQSTKRPFFAASSTFDDGGKPDLEVL